MVDSVQVILIEAFADGGCSIDHKHRDFSAESYHCASPEGVVAAVHNLLHGFKPRLADLYRKPGQPGRIVEDLPQPLD